MNQSLLAGFIRHENKDGNHWYEDDQCRCGVFINDCDNEYTYFSKSGYNHIKLCPDCYRKDARDRMDRLPRHPFTGQRIADWKKYTAQKLGASRGQPGWQEALDMAQDMLENDCMVWLDTILPSKARKEFQPTIRSVVRNEKTRNSVLRKHLLQLYNHVCQVQSCLETETEVSHILAHHHEDSVDNETNARLFCATHHRAFDGGRMFIEDSGKFVRFNHHGSFVEHGQIIYHDQHKINPVFEKKTREYHARKKQKMD